MVRTRRESSKSSGTPPDERPDMQRPSKARRLSNGSRAPVGGSVDSSTSSSNASPCITEVITEVSTAGSPSTDRDDSDNGVIDDVPPPARERPKGKGKRKASRDASGDNGKVH
ncbi:unnamed protein product, partial [Scytosiphon promiscuus]